MAHAAERAKQVEVRTERDSSTVSTSSARRRLDLTERGQVDPLTVSICGPDPAFSTASTVRRRLGVSAESTPSAAGSWSAISTTRSAHTGERASSSSHPIGRRGEVLISGIYDQPLATRLRAQRPARHTVGGERHRQQHCLGGLSAAATRFDRARPGRPAHGLLHGPDPARLNTDRPRH